jgi:hypothetical protein
MVFPTRFFFLFAEMEWNMFEEGGKSSPYQKHAAHK